MESPLTDIDVIEKRRSIMIDQNTAQRTFQTILDGILNASPSATNITEIHTEYSLYGDLDLSILEQRGFRNIRNIIFHAGNITSLTGFPKELVKIECDNQLLITLDGLPTNMIQIHCSHNYLKTISLGKLSRLEILVCNHNNISDFDEFPATLRELQCNDNSIIQLDLFGLKRLKQLQCSNNRLLAIKNLPMSLNKLVMENNPMAVIEHIARNTRKEYDTTSKINTEAEFNEKINEYFQLKNKYEETILAKKRAVYHTALKTGKMNATIGVAKVKKYCVNCNNVGGSVFTLINNKWTAYCAATNPCNLNISLARGYNFYFYDTLMEYKDKVQDVKNKFILQKMNILFGYLTEKNGSVNFKNMLEKYNNIAQTYVELTQKYDELYNNKSKHELIIKKQEGIYDILQQLRTTMDEIHGLTDKNSQEANELRILIRNYNQEATNRSNLLQKLRYSWMEVEIRETIDEKYMVTEGDGGFTGKKKKIEGVLIQNENPLTSLVIHKDTTYGV
jgi:hypothetical protein